ncbi:hypothetical protein ACJX0J_014807 [Zea mays]
MHEVVIPQVLVVHGGWVLQRLFTASTVWEASGLFISHDRYYMLMRQLQRKSEMKKKTSLNGQPMLIYSIIRILKIHFLRGKIHGRSFKFSEGGELSNFNPWKWKCVGFYGFWTTNIPEWRYKFFAKRHNYKYRDTLLNPKGVSKKSIVNRKLSNFGRYMLGK